MRINIKCKMHRHFSEMLMTLNFCIFNILLIAWYNIEFHMRMKKSLFKKKVITQSRYLCLPDICLINKF